MSKLNKNQAMRKAKALCKKLGPEWQPSIMENDGWHYCARSVDGLLNCHESPGRDGDPPTYWCLLSAGTHPGTGEVFWSPGDGQFLTPRSAVRYQVQLAEQFTRRCARVVERCLALEVMQ